MLEEIHRKLAIIGAGPAGLTLALILAKHNIPFVVYEASKTPLERSTGGTLDLHEDSGQFALREAGIYDAFLKLARYGGEDYKLLDKHGNVWVDERSEESWRGRPEIDRNTLQTLLLEHVDPKAVRWGYRLREVKNTEDGTFQLHFDGNVVETANLVVGADGAWSKVRQLLTDDRPFYSAISHIEFVHADVDIRKPNISKTVGRGSMFCFGDNKTILAQRLGDGSIHAYAQRRCDESWLKEFNYNEVQQCKDTVLKHFGGWNDEVLDLIRQADDTPGSVWGRPLYMLPVGNTFQHRKGVTLIGDAAHLMTPFAGQGVNIAMLDSAQLALAIVDNYASKEGLDKAIEAFEKSMFERAKEAQERTFQRLTLRFMDGFPLQSAKVIVGLGFTPGPAFKQLSNGIS
jgi:2-polyprenyl-6-methoxyphenol hydroxylase-like FAD-dependent oxidoreductase